MPSEILISAIFILAEAIFWISGPNKIWEVSQVFFGGNWAIMKSSKNHFPMVRVIHFRSFSSFFFEKWPPGKSWKNNFSGIPWNQGPSWSPLGARAPNSIQDSLNESSVRPNGTPVMPVLRPGSGPPVGPPVGPPGGCAGTFGLSACEILISAFWIAAKVFCF